MKEYTPKIQVHQLVEQVLNTSSGKGGDVITLIIHIVAIVEEEDQ